jgi:hypothetical protein
MEVDEGLPQYFFTSVIVMPIFTILLPQRNVSAAAAGKIIKSKAIVRATLMCIF